jgi:hypothetical protein
MVAGEMLGTNPSSTALAAKRLSVQWSCPLGAGLQAMVIRWASYSPESA